MFRLALFAKRVHEPQVITSLRMQATLVDEFCFALPRETCTLLAAVSRVVSRQCWCWTYSTWRVRCMALYWLDVPGTWRRGPRFRVLRVIL